ncbi:hypothetical protein ACLOJK_011863 [Asimina triloba]
MSSTCSLLSKESGGNFCYSNNQICAFDWSISRDSSASLRCSEVGLIYRPEKKAATVFPQPRRDDSNTKQSGTEAPIHEGCSDQNKSFQLSSGCITPSLVSNGCEPPGAIEFDSWDQLCLAQSMSFSDIFDRISAFDGSRINPLEEASLVLDGTPDDIAKVCEDEVQAGEVVAWLHDSLESEIKYSSFTCNESTGSSYDNSLFEDSSVLDSSWSSLSTNEDSCSQVCEFDGTDIWLSVLDLEGEDCKWASDKMQGFDDLPPDFPSPSFHTKQNSYFKSSDYGSSFSQESSNADLLSELTSEAKEQFLCEGSSKLDLEGFSADEPLFWPFDQNSKWHLETDWCCLSISPRKDIGLFGKRSASLRLPERRAALLQRGALKGVLSRRILFESKSSVSSIISCKTKDGNKQVTAIGSKPSRLSCSTRCSSEQQSHFGSMKSSPTKMKENPSQISSKEVQPSHLQQPVSRRELQLNKNMNNISKMSTEKSTKTKNEEPDALIQPSLERLAEVDQEFLSESLDSSKEAPIETLVGLNEFNGHEGIDTDFDDGGFFFDGL